MAPKGLETQNDVLEQQKTPENTDQKLKKEFEKKDGKENITNAINSMAKVEIGFAKLDMSPDERRNPKYVQKFDSAYGKLSDAVNLINSRNGKPEEKTKQLEIAFTQFQKEIAIIKGTKEGMDAQRSTKQAQNMREEGEANVQKNKDFKKDLLEVIENVVTQKLEAQKLKAAQEGSIEQKLSQAEANFEQGSTGEVTLAFGPPGIMEKRA